MPKYLAFDTHFSVAKDERPANGELRGANRPHCAPTILDRQQPLTAVWFNVDAAELVADLRWQD
jgi:hypothetical protein